MKKTLLFLLLTLCLLLGGIGAVWAYYSVNVPKHYPEINFPTPTLIKGRNSVQGIVLHHTATLTVDQSLHILAGKGTGRSTHVLIDYDGTRYILAQPEARTCHAGYSQMEGREWCNNFTIGIEFQGSTDLVPLTGRQIASAVEYIEPLMKKYHIPIEKIMTHEMVRDAYIKAHPDRHVDTKIDIVQLDYKRVLNAMK